MPTLAFGQKQRQIPRSELIKEYKDLYYEEPEINWKQRESNKFTLTMCSSARWRFQSKLESEYEDVRKMINNEKLINKHKRDRMYAFKAEIIILNKTVHGTKNFIDKKVGYVSSKNGHEEQLEYWTKVRRRSNVVIDTLATKVSRLDTLLSKATDMFGPGPQTAATREKKRKERRAVKRLKKNTSKATATKTMTAFLKQSPVIKQDTNVDEADIDAVDNEQDIVKDSNTHSDVVGDEATDVEVPMV